MRLFSLSQAPSKRVLVLFFGLVVSFLALQRFFFSANGAKNTNNNNNFDLRRYERMSLDDIIMPQQVGGKKASRQRGVISKAERMKMIRDSKLPFLEQRRLALLSNCKNQPSKKQDREHQEHNKKRRIGGHNDDEEALSVQQREARVARCLVPDFTQPELVPGIPMAVGQNPIDPGIARAVDEIVSRGLGSILDLGAGIGQFGFWLAQNSLIGNIYYGMDGAPNVEEYTLGFIQFTDLTVPHALGGIEFEWVLCLSVAEYIPVQFEEVFFENLILSARKGIIMSWPPPSLSDQIAGALNLRSNQYVIEKMRSHGFSMDSEMSLRGRSLAETSSFKDSFMVFLRHI